MIKNENWYASGLHFECTQCGNCCSGVPGYVWVSQNEIKEIADFLKLSTEEFAKQFLRLLYSKISLIELPNYDCIFLQRIKEGIKCKIYPVRPAQCRTWPFWKMNLKDSSAFLNNTKRCQGINRGKKFPQNQIDELKEKSPC